VANHEKILARDNVSFIAATDPKTAFGERGTQKGQKKRSWLYVRPRRLVGYINETAVSVPGQKLPGS
jgi:hypothetical protein